MSDQEAAKIVRQGLASPVTAFGIIAAIVAATATATGFYWSVNNNLAELTKKVAALEASDTKRDKEMTDAVAQFRGDLQKMQISITSVETSLRFLVEAQRRRPAD